MDLPPATFNHIHNQLFIVRVGSRVPRRCTSRGQVTQPFLRKVKEPCVVRFHPGTVGSSPKKFRLTFVYDWKKMACPSESPLSAVEAIPLSPFPCWRFNYTNMPIRFGWKVYVRWMMWFLICVSANCGHFASVPNRENESFRWRFGCFMSFGRLDKSVIFYHAFLYKLSYEYSKSARCWKNRYDLSWVFFCWKKKKKFSLITLNFWQTTLSM